MPDQGTTRLCRTCGEQRPLSAFSRSTTKRSGYQSRCKPCDNARRATYHQAHRAETAARMARTPQPNRAKHSAAWKAKHPEEMRRVMRAAMAVFRAIKGGILVRPTTCDECGQRRYITAAHADYDRPLDVRWLCRSCHSTWDRADPKTR